jgi:hypothetical protein
LPFGQTHAPPAQTWSLEQVFPHPPQLFGSVCSSTQDCAQSAFPPVQTVMHEPDRHAISAPHICPHPPQFLPSPFVSTHAPAQSFVPTVQTHEPPEHSWPGPHDAAHPPQCFGSLWVSTQAPEHIVVVAEAHPQNPAEQPCPAPQAFPQLPQF